LHLEACPAAREIAARCFLPPAGGQVVGKLQPEAVHLLLLLAPQRIDNEWRGSDFF
jgi:hypothetical protein